MGIRKITAEQKAEIQVKYESGVKSQQIMKEYNISNALIRKYAKLEEWKVGTERKKYFDHIATKTQEQVEALSFVNVVKKHDETPQERLSRLAQEHGVAKGIAVLEVQLILERIRAKHLRLVESQLDLQSQILSHMNPKEMIDYEGPGTVEGENVTKKITVYRPADIKNLDMIKHLQGLGIVQTPMSLTQINNHNINGQQGASDTMGDIERKILYAATTQSFENIANDLLNSHKL